MENASPSLFNRPDTMLGVCEGGGQDLGFNPIYLRIAFAVLLLWNPVAVAGAYLSLGVALMVTHWVFRAPKPAETPTLHAVAGDKVEEVEVEEVRLPIAA